MVTRSGAALRMVVPVLLTTALATAADPVALGATPLCQVRNIPRRRPGGH
ncbi:hypothetical protein BH24CHL9_BH24CHL9_02810 [soil metagenome]